MILLFDNHDSFTYNLLDYFAQLGVSCIVVKNDEYTLEEISKLAFKAIVISPGPGKPKDAGMLMDLIAKYHAQVPILGVCLGHQAIGEAFGATVSRAPELLHGKTSQVIHNGGGVLSNLPSPFTATRYHSLAVERDTVPTVLEITGSTESGVVMSIRHTTLPIEGVQFHPESVLTEHGHQMLANWLVTCGDTDAPKRAVGLSPVVGSSQ